MDEPPHCRLYNWLVQSNTVTNCENQVDQSKILQRLIIEVDSIALLEFDSYLGNCLIGNYQLFCQLIQEVLFEVLLERVESKNQLLCVVRPTPTLTHDDLDNWQSSVNSSALVTLWGQIVAVKDVVSYTQSTQYKCPVETCTGADDSAHIRVYTVKSRECDVISSTLHCMYCGEVLYEDVSKRSLGTRMSASLHVHESIKDSYYVDQTTELIVRDELISKVTLGSRVSVVGLPLSKLNPVSCTIIHRIEVVNIEPLSHPVPHLVPHSLREVCSAREQSPWQLINLLAFCVTPDTLPQGSYHALKQLLLLSLVPSTPVTDKSSPLYLATAHVDHNPGVNLLVQARDTLPISVLLNHFSTLANCRSVSGGAHLGGNREGSALHIGSLQAAPNGVTLVGDVDLMRKETRSDLSIILQNRATISGKKKCEIFPLTSVIWGFQSEYSKHTPPPAWDVIYRVSKEFDDESTVQHLLDEESSSILPDVDVKAYLALASNITVGFDEQCTHLIAGYCQASKSVRYGSGYELPVNSPYTLSLLAANHARINLRNQVLNVDAVIAIKLYEESLFCYQRYSTVDLKLHTHVLPGEEDIHLGENVDTEIEHFYSKLVNFCSTHIPGFAVGNED